LPKAQPSRAAARVRDLLVRHLARGDADLASVEVDLAGVPDFQRRVLERLHKTRPGETLTYGQLAALVGSPGASRAVGTAMARNPVPIIVPCHRVVGANGWPGGYSGLGGLDTKRRLLALEKRARTLDAF
jgi:methylated-DNA-[protein]-cysteine S-methyltransferase